MEQGMSTGLQVADLRARIDYLLRVVVCHCLGCGGWSSRSPVLAGTIKAKGRDWREGKGSREAPVFVKEIPWSCHCPWGGIWLPLQVSPEQWSYSYVMPGWSRTAFTSLLPGLCLRWTSCLCLLWGLDFIYSFSALPLGPTDLHKHMDHCICLVYQRAEFWMLFWGKLCRSFLV